MSIKLMSQAWELALPDSEKLILLALADFANDEGEAWPSMATLARKCSKSDRTIQAAVKSLVGKGHLSREERPGRGCRYMVHPRSGFTPEAASPPKRSARTPEAASDKPSRTTNKSSGGKPPSEKRVRDCRPDDGQLHRFVDAWNDMADGCGLPRSRGLNGRRTAGLQGRIAEHGEDAVLEAIRNVGASEFLRGKNDRSWRADFGWLLTSEENFLKVLEGRYGSVAPSGVQSTVLDRVRADLERKRSTSSAVHADDGPRNPMVRAIIAEQAERAAQVRPIGQIFDQIGGFDE